MMATKATPRTKSPTSSAENEISRLRNELDNAKIVMDDKDRSIDVLARLRDAAEKRALDAEKSMAVCGDVLRSAEARAASAAKLALQLRLELARKEGYIDRIRETDAGAITTPVRNPMPGEIDTFFLDDVRGAMAKADDGTFDRMVSSMSEETLNKVLGKTNDEQSDILR